MDKSAVMKMMRGFSAVCRIAVLLIAGGCSDEPTSPGPVEAIRWASVSAGAQHTCALAESGSTYCWGTNQFGQLGRPDSASYEPRAVMADDRWTQLASGGTMTCGVNQAGSTLCWGRLAGISPFNAFVPRPIDGDPGFTALAAGAGHVCGIARDGRSYCWGLNFRGQLGIGLIGGTIYGARDKPTPVAGGETFSVLAPSYEMTCALSTAGGHFCWGGLTTDDGGTTPGRSLYGPPPFDTLVVGGAHGREHQCGLTPQRELHCFGFNLDGQVGSGRMGFTDGTFFEPVTRVLLPGGPNIVAVTAGGDAWIEDDVLGPGQSYFVFAGHTCALSVAGDAYCWGNNRYGQLGDGSTQSRSQPVRVEGSHRFVRLDAGGNHTCGVTAAAEVYCWGSNRYGQLGSGQRARSSISSIPVRVSAPRG